MTGGDKEQRPPVAVAHVVLYTARMELSAQYMHIIGPRPIFEGPQVSVFELRGGTHLLLLHQEGNGEGDASFDLMVDDLHATHARFTSLGLSPSPIEAREAIGHEVFTVREPGAKSLSFQAMPPASRCER